MNSLLFDNLLSWSAEVSILAIAAAGAAYALHHPRARLYFWQAILAAALILPAIAPWKQPVVVSLASTEPVALVNHGVVVPVPASASWGAVQLFEVLAAGAALRLLWVAAGLLRLASEPGEQEHQEDESRGRWQGSGLERRVAQGRAGKKKADRGEEHTRVHRPRISKGLEAAEDYARWM